jgi:hypothetical protein
MSTQNKEFVLSVFRANGRADALDLRGRASGMDGTAIIAEEEKIPAWDGTKDYTVWPAGAPVTFEGNVFGLLQPHNAANYPGVNPGNSPALWSVKHTKDPRKAKQWLSPLGTSGMYMTDECCTFEGGIYRSVVDNNPYSPGDYAPNWEVVEV